MSTALRIDRIEKNYLINGGMDFFQRGGAIGTVNLTTTPTYLAADRYKMSYTGTVTGTPNTTRVTSTLSPARAKYAVQLAGQRNASTLVFTMEQRLEGIEARELAYTGSASFSVWVFTPITGCSVRLTLNTPTVEDNYTSVTQLSQQTSSTTITASTWTKITFSNLTISSAANNGLAVVMDLQIPSGTDGSAQNHLITQMMMNSGSTASDFCRSGNNIGRELHLCQRFYGKSYNPDVNPGTVTNNGRQVAISAATGSNLSSTSFYKVTMRSAPSVLMYSPVTGTVNAADNGGNVGASAGGVGQNAFEAGAAAGVTPATYVTWHWTADAEL